MQSHEAPNDSRSERCHQLPSPSVTKAERAHIQSSHTDSLTRKRKTRSPGCAQSEPKQPKKARLLSEPSDTTTSIKKWLSSLQPGEDFDEDESMNPPPPKRSRSSDSLGRALSQSGDGSESTVSRDRKYSTYKDVNYPVVLETKGSFMRSSESGLVEEDKSLCEKLLSASQPPPVHSLFDERFDKFHSLIRGRSEARVYLDLHPLLVPSVENLYISGQEEFGPLIEGHNDLWVKSIPFYGPRPQPDHTYGFKWSNFTETQRQKLNIEPSEKSYYTAREDIYFPFLVSEVKCGKQGLDLADRPNANSMTIALRGIVDLYRKADRAAEVHRRVLGFSISHDDRTARIYAHYPEIDGESTTYFRDTIREFPFGAGKGQDRWQCYQFTLNVCQTFAPALLKRLMAMADKLPDPIEPALEQARFDDFSIQSSQDDSSAPESQAEGVRNPRRGGGMNAGSRPMNQNLQRQLEQQLKDARDRETTLTAQWEQLRIDSEQQRKDLVQMLKEQREQLKEQREQLKEQSERMKEQSEQMKELLRQR